MAAAKVGGILANNTFRAEFIYDNLAMATSAIHGSYTAGVEKLLFWVRPASIPGSPHSQCGRMLS